MREIKFRAWDTESNTMYTWGNPYFKWDISRVGPNYVLMQFTGLKDKNGKEIYEGDIISAPEGDGRVYKIKWDDSEPRFDAISGNGNPRVFRDMKNGEIIGNIYENSDLLK